MKATEPTGEPLRTLFLYTGEKENIAEALRLLGPLSHGITPTNAIRVRTEQGKYDMEIGMGLAVYESGVAEVIDAETMREAFDE